VTGPVTEFLTVDDALEVARLVIGEPARVRDFADLDAALARPRQTEDGRELLPGIWDKAAALMESLAHSYALVDGNKRLTWNATWYFLGVNGHPLAEPLDEEAAFQFMYDLVRGRITASAIAERLQKFAA
jgi:death on curing protein